MCSSDLVGRTGIFTGFSSCADLDPDFFGAGLATVFTATFLGAAFGATFFAGLALLAGFETLAAFFFALATTFLTEDLLGAGFFFDFAITKQPLVIENVRKSRKVPVNKKRNLSTAELSHFTDFQAL